MISCLVSETKENK